MKKAPYLDFDLALPRQKKLPAFIRSVGHFLLSKPDPGSCRVCNFGELFWCIDGKGIFEYNGRRHVLKPGGVWYYPPGSHHLFYPAEGEFNYRWFTIEGEMAGALFQSAGLQPGVNGGGPCPEELFNVLQQGIRNSTRKKSMHLLSVGFEIICRAVAGDSRKIQAKDYVRKAGELMERDFSDPALNIQAVAELLGVHRVQLSREFSKHYGVTMSVYLKNLRLQKALEMIRKSSFSLGEIAGECGFSSADYLGKVVSEVTGERALALRRRETDLK